MGSDSVAKSGGNSHITGAGGCVRGPPPIWAALYTSDESPAKAPRLVHKICFNIWPLIVVGIAVALAFIRNVPKPPHATKIGPKRLPAGSESHEWYYLDDVFANDTIKELYGLIEEHGTYRTAVDDRTSSVQHIGEARPVGLDGNCPHPFLVKNFDAPSNQTLCVLPQRIDVARHHLMTGGRGGYKEKYDRLVSRMLTFLSYHFEEGVEDPRMKPLFESKQYQEKAALVCQNRTHFDNFQLNMVLVLPGQQLGFHWDVPWFWGASRWTLPQWLLVVMANSRLWEDKQLPQIQGVSWLHNDGSVNNTKSGARFVFYPEGAARPGIAVPSAYNKAVVVDGCKVAHGVERYKPSADLPKLNKKDQHTLVHTGDHHWQLRTNGYTRKQYDTKDFRLTLAWRARCFYDAEEQADWRKSMEDDRKIELEDVLSTLEADLRDRGHLAAGSPRPAPLQFAMMLLDVYGSYPVDNRHSSVIPYNYCVLPRIAPAWARGALDALVTPFCTE